LRFRLACLNVATAFFLSAAIVAAGAIAFLLLSPGPPLTIVAGLAPLWPAPPPETPTSPPLPSATESPQSTPTEPSPTVAPTATQTPTPTATLPPTPDATLVLGPYLQSPRRDQIVVMWEVDRDTTGEVAFGPADGELSLQVDPSSARRRHEVTLTGLEPGTSYRYQVRINGAPLAPERTFRTLPDGSQGLRFAVLGDTQSGHAVHTSIVEQIVNWGPDFVLHTGDLVSDGTSVADWHSFFGAGAPLLAERVLFPAMGNHDMGPEHVFDFFDPPGTDPWYSFDVGPARFIALQVDGLGSYDEDSTQYRWLEQQLEENDRPWVIVWFHIPPYAASAVLPADPLVRDALVPLFKRYAVDLVLSGHHHNYQRFERGHVTYIITGGGGGSLLGVKPDDEPGAFIAAHHFVAIQIEGDTLTGKAIAPDGSVIDRFAISE